MLPLAADVNIYTSSPDYAANLIGNHENTEVGKFLRDFLEVDVDAITRELTQLGPKWDTVSATGVKESWLGPLPPVDIGHDHLDHYQGDFKKYKRCDLCGTG
jgi:alkaline phosphatase